jgi:hypothetical protein
MDGNWNELYKAESVTISRKVTYEYVALRNDQISTIITFIFVVCIREGFWRMSDVYYAFEKFTEWVIIINESEGMFSLLLLVVLF